MFSQMCPWTCFLTFVLDIPPIVLHVSFDIIVVFVNAFRFVEDLH